MEASTILLLSASEQGKVVSTGIDLPWNLFLQWISLFVTVWILYKLLFKPVTEFLDKRREMIDKTITEAKSQKENADFLKSNYEAKLTDAKEEVSQILKEARAKAIIREKEIIKQAREEAEIIRQKTLNDLTLEQERIREEVKKQMIEISSMIAIKFVRESMDEIRQNELIEEAIKDMEAVEWLG